jgi:hypothetical protein
MRTTAIAIAALALVACVSAEHTDDVSFDELEQMLNGVASSMDLDSLETLQDDKMDTPTIGGSTNLDEAIFGRRRRRRRRRRTATPAPTPWVHPCDNGSSTCK